MRNMADLSGLLAWCAVLHGDAMPMGKASARLARGRTG
jgi:hypothetical protein